MATLCIEGNVPPSDVLYVLEWDDAVHLAEIVDKRTTDAWEREADLHRVLADGQIKQSGQIVKALGNLGKSLANALRG